MENKNSLAKIAIAINLVLIVLIIILFTKVGNNVESESNPVLDNNTSISENDSSLQTNISIETPINSNGRIAFFNMDSLNSKLVLFSEIEKEIKEAGLAAEKKMRKKQGDIDAWKSKWEKKGKLLSSEEQQYYQEAEKMQAQAMQFEQNVQMKLAQEQEELMKTYAIRISNYASDFAKSKGFDAVFAYQFGQSPWYYNTSLDITNELAVIMNDAFTGSSNISE